MKRRTFPLWLIRDLPALIGITLSFWPLVIMVIANGAKAMRGKKIAPAVYEHLMLMLPLAEAKLRHALYRQAFRAFGWNPKLAPREQLPAVTSWAEFLPRFEAYRLAMMDLREASQTFTDMLRQHYRIRTRVDANTVRAAHASTDAACAAAQHELAGIATSSSRTSQEALMLSSARSARPSKHERGLANARGPPTSQFFQGFHTLSTLARLRPLGFVRTRTYSRASHSRRILHLSATFAAAANRNPLLRRCV